MLPRTRRLLPRLARLSMTLGIAAIAVTACRPAVRGTIAPSASGLVVRNTSAFDVNVYAMPSDEGTPVWLATVPASGTRFLALERRQLQRDSGLVVRTQALGSSAAWTSGKLTVGDAVIAVLDVVADWAGDCSKSNLFSVDLREAAAIR